MKKLFSISLLFSVAAMMFTGCVSEEDDLFDSSAAERLMTSKKMYTDRLGGSTWVMEFYPLNSDEAPKGQGYLILNKFNRDGSVVQAMQNELTDGQYLTDTSLWEIISDQGTVLTFNTFNKCIHMFSDPGLYQTGQGFEGDYEFVILSLEEDAKYGMLKGKKRATYNRLTRLPDDVNFEEYLKDVNGFQNTIFSSSAPNDCMMNIGDSVMVVTNASTGIISIYPLGGDPISQTTDHAFTITKNDGKYYLRFREELAGKNDDKVQEFVYDETTDVFKSLENENNVIKGVPAVDFFVSALDNSKLWQYNTAGENSDNIKNAYEIMQSELLSLGWTLNNTKFSKLSDGRYVIRFAVVNKKKSSRNLEYVYNISANDGKVMVQYVEPYVTEKDVVAQNVLNAAPSVQSFLEEISGTYEVHPKGTGFDLRNIILKSEKSMIELQYTSK